VSGPGRLPAPPLPERIARLLPFERSLVEVDGLKLHVMEAGPAGAPVALLVHGNPAWGFLWRKVAGALAGAGLRVVMPDLAGLGLSDKPREPGFHTLARHAAIVRGLVEALTPGPIVLAVHDWGGPIALAALSDLPGRLAGLVVTNTGVRPPRIGSRATAFHRFSNLPLVSDAAFKLLGFPQNALHRAQADRASIRGDVAFAYRWPLRSLADRTAPLAMARMVPISQDHPSVEGLRRVHAFTAAFTGPAAIEALPRATVVHVPAGHYLQEEAPVPIADAIREVAHRARLV
jgi:pimeloyl-ACP methyl ester carboxylesterase